MQNPGNLCRLPGFCLWPPGAKAKALFTPGGLRSSAGKARRRAERTAPRLRLHRPRSRTGGPRACSRPARCGGCRPHSPPAPVPAAPPGWLPSRIHCPVRTGSVIPPPIISYAHAIRNRLCQESGKRSRCGKTKDSPAGATERQGIRGFGWMK